MSRLGLHAEDPLPPITVIPTIAPKLRQTDSRHGADTCQLRKRERAKMHPRSNNASQLPTGRSILLAAEREGGEVRRPASTSAANRDKEETIKTA